MISAIAARKAAAAAKKSTNSSAAVKPTISAQNIASLIEVPSESPSKNVNSKRKPSTNLSHSASAPPIKKKKRTKRPEQKRARYFDEEAQGGDAFLKQDDLIVVASEGSEEEIFDDDSVSEDEGITTPKAPTASTSRRKWSPSGLLNDSSDDDDDDQVHALTQKATAVIPTPNPILSSFHPVPNQNTFPLTAEEIASLGLEATSAVSALKLAPDDTICILGTYAFTLTHGSISICGSSLAPSPLPHRVFAPRSSPLPVLQCVPQKQTMAGTSLPQLLPPRLRSLIHQDEKSAVILLHALRTGVEGLGRVCRTFDRVFEPSRWQNLDGVPQFDIPGTFNLAQQSRDTQPFYLPSTWSSALSRIVKSPPTTRTGGVYLVKGPKKSGKSHMAKTLLNQLLTQYQQVAFLECDLGQSEFTPGGMVSLNILNRPIFGPSFTHPTLPHLAHYVGATSPRNSPSHYLTAVQAIMQYYRLDVQCSFFDPASESDDSRISDVIPLVVNTMGWTKGLGVDLARKIEDIVEPSDILEIQATIYEASSWSATPVVPAFPQNYHGTDVRTYVLQPVPASMLSTSYSPIDHRTISILSYFHASFPAYPSSAMLPVQRTATTWNTALPLCAMTPYEVDCSVALEKVILAGAGTEDVVPGEIERVLNGAIVGLVACEPGSIDMDMDVSAPTTVMPYTQGFSVPAPSTSSCYGLALVRSTSSSSTVLHMLTPIPPSLLGKTKVIVKGEMELPVWGMLDFRSETACDGSTSVPYLQWGRGEGIGAEKKRVRRNLMRKGQA